MPKGQDLEKDLIQILSEELAKGIDAQIIRTLLDIDERIIKTRKILDRISKKNQR